MRFYEIIVEGYKEATAEFNTVSNPDEVQALISKYKDLVNRNQIVGNERNIDYWRKQGFDAFKKFVSGKSQLKSASQLKRNKVNAGQEKVLRDDAAWKITIPLNREASCSLGKGTTWCVSANSAGNAFHGYFKRSTLIFCIRKADNAKWAINFGHNEPKFFNANDDEIGEEGFNQQTGLNAAELISRATGDADVTNARKTLSDRLKKINAKIKNIKDNHGDQDPALEQEIVITNDFEGLGNLISAYTEANKKLKPLAPGVLNMLFIMGDGGSYLLFGTEFEKFLKLLDPSDTDKIASRLPAAVIIFPEFKSFWDKVLNLKGNHTLYLAANAQYEYPDSAVLKLFSTNTQLLSYYDTALKNNVGNTTQIDRLAAKYGDSVPSLAAIVTSRTGKQNSTAEFATAFSHDYSLASRIIDAYKRAGKKLKPLNPDFLSMITHQSISTFLSIHHLDLGDFLKLLDPKDLDTFASRRPELTVVLPEFKSLWGKFSKTKRFSKTLLNYYANSAEYRLPENVVAQMQKYPEIFRTYENKLNS